MSVGGVLTGMQALGGIFSDDGPSPEEIIAMKTAIMNKRDPYSQYSKNQLKELANAMLQEAMMDPRELAQIQYDAMLPMRSMDFEMAGREMAAAGIRGGLGTSASDSGVLSQKMRDFGQESIMRHGDVMRSNLIAQAFDAQFGKKRGIAGSAQQSAQSIMNGVDAAYQTGKQSPNFFERMGDLAGNLPEYMKRGAQAQAYSDQGFKAMAQKFYDTYEMKKGNA